MANRYWVGNGTVWSSISSWSATSGGASGATIPVSTDDVFFNASSGNAVVDGTTSTCNNLNCVGFSGSLYGITIVTPVNIYGSLTLSSTMILTQPIGLQFKFFGNSIGRTITTAGQVCSYITFDMDGGDITLQDNVTCNQQFFFGNGGVGMSDGTVYANGKTITCTSQGINSNSVYGGTFDITNSTLNSVYQFNISPNLTFISTNSTINVSGGLIFNGNSRNYNIVNTTSGNVTFNDVCTIPYLNVAGATSLVLNSGVTINNLTLSNDVSIVSGLTLSNGLVSSNIVSTQRTITLVGGITPLVTREDFRDINITPSVNFSAITGGSGDLGNNNGITFTSAQAQYFKITGTTANFVDTTNWFTSSGGVVQGRIPLAQDTSVFDSNSFVGTTSLTINSSVNTGSMNFSGITQIVSLKNSAYNLSIYGSLILSTGLTWDFSSIGYLYMKSITSQTITSNGGVLSGNRIYYDGIGGSWTLLDDFSSISTNSYLVNGTLNTNNFNYNSSDGLFDTVAGTKTLTLGSSTLTCTRFRNGAPINFIFNAGTSTVVINSIGVNDEIAGTNVFYNLTIQSTNAACIVSLDSNQYIKNLLTINGYSNSGTTRRILIQSSVYNTTRTITASSISASYVDFRDISVPLSSNWNLSGITGGSGDAGGNSNITFTPSQSQYWYRGTGSWSNPTKWFTETNGGGVQGRVPLPQDDVYVDQNSLSGSTTVTMDCLRSGKDMNFSGTTSLFTLTLINAWTIYGSLTFSSNMNLGGTWNYVTYFEGRGSHYITSNGKRFIQQNIFQGVGGTYTLLDDFGSFSTVAIIYGTFNANDKNVLAYRLGSSYSSVRSIILGSGIWSIYRSVEFFNSTNLTFNSTNSTIRIIDVTTADRYCYGNMTYNNFEIYGGGISSFTFYGSNTFNSLKIYPKNVLYFTAGTTTTVGTLLAEGTPTSGITISSVTSSPHTLVKSGTGTVTTNYCNISYSTATSSFRARNSVNGGNNTGWVISTGDNRYWVGGTGDWSDPSHWAFASGGVSTEVLGSELVTNGGAVGATDWIDSDSDGAADGFSPIRTSYSIVTGNGFTGRAQRLDALTTGNQFGTMTPILTLNKRYLLSLSYRNNNGMTLYLGRDSIKVTLAPNTGTSLTYSGYYIFDNTIGSTIRIYVRSSNGDAQAGDWFEIDNVSIKEVMNIPNFLTDAIFDQNSFTGTSTVTVNSNSDCFNMNWSGITQNVTLLNSAYILSVYGSLTLWTGLTWTFSSTGYLYMRATDLQYITTNGVIIHDQQLYFDGIGGKWVNLDDFKNVGIILTNGELDTNDKNISCDFIRTQNGIKTLTLGNSIITCDNSFQMFSTTNLTMTPNTATINCQYSNRFGGFVYGGTVNIYINSGTVNLTIDGGNTFNNLFVSIGSTFLYFQMSGDNVITDTLTISGYNSTNNRLLITSDIIGTQRKITANNIVVAQNVDFRDIYLSGSTTFDLSNITGFSGDGGGNSGITFTPSQTQYFKHTSGVVSWSDSTKWFTSSGGLVQGRVPLPQDDVIFDENSFSGTSNLSVNCSRFGSLNMSAVNQSVTYTRTVAVEVYGSYVLGSNITLVGSFDTNFLGRNGNFVINGYNKNLYNVNVFGIGSLYTLLSNMTLSNWFLTNYGGTFDANDFDITCSGGIYFNSPTIVYMGNGTWTTIYSAAGTNIFQISSIVYCEGSTVKFAPQFNNTNLEQINISTKVLNKIWFSGPFTGVYQFNSTSSCNEMLIDEGFQIKFYNGTTQTLNKLTAIGTVNSGITITSPLSGSTHTLLLTSGGTADVRYANISYSNASPSMIARSSINMGGNSTGWTFTVPRFWIGDSGNWNDPTHWSATSGGLSGFTLGQELVLNGGAPYQTNFVDSNSDGIADYFQNVYGGTMSIVTGNGFSRAQRIVCNDGSLNLGFLQTSTLKDAVSYTYSFKYRSSKTISFYRFGTYQQDAVFPANTGTSITVSGVGVNYQYTSLLFLMPVAVTEIGDWMEIGEITVKENIYVPISSSDAIFDVNSFSTGSTVTINALAECNSMDWTGLDQSVTLTNSSYNLDVYGSLTLWTGLTWNFTSTGYLNMKSTSLGNFITSNGTTMNLNRIYFDGVGGSWILQDDCYFGITRIHLANGSFFTNNKNLAAGRVQTETGTKSIILGSSTITLSDIWYDGAVSVGYSVNCGTSTIIVNGGQGFVSPSFLTYYNLIINFNTTSQIVGINIFNNVTISGLTYLSNTPMCRINLQQTINGILTINGYNSTNTRMLLYDLTLGGINGQRSVFVVNPLNVFISNTDFRDITFTNPIDLSSITGLSGDAGGNSGITFTPSQTQYWYQGTGSWSNSNKWFTQTNGGGIQGRVPLPQDDVIFDQNSFSGTSTLTIDCARIGKNLDMSLVNQTINPNLLNAVESYGSFILCDGFTFINNQYVYLMGRNNTYNVNLYNKTFYGISILGSANYNFISGCTLGYFLSLAGSGTVNLGNCTFIFSLANSTLFGCVPATNLICGTSTFKFTQVSGGVGVVGFGGGGKTYNKIWLVSSSYNDYFIVSNSSTFNELVIDAGRKIKFAEGTTTTINTLTAIGTPDSGITITSYTSGLTHTINKIGSGSVDVRYTNISYSSGTTNLTAKYSTDGGGNLNWDFPTARYWIGNSGNWSDPTHWSDVSGGPSGTTSLSSNLVVNADFTYGFNNWQYTTIATLISGYTKIDYNISNPSSILGQDIYIIGRNYEVTFDYKLTDADNGFRIYKGLSYQIPYPIYIADDTWHTITQQIVADGTLFKIRAIATPAGDKIAYVDNFSVKEIISVPTELSDVIFDSNSFSGTSTVTINTGATCNSMDWMGLDQAVTFTNSSYDLNVYGSLTLFTGLVWNFTSLGSLYFKSTSLGNTITTNGVNLSLSNGFNIYFDGVGGSWINQDDFTASAGVGIYLVNGTWNTNSKTINIIAGTISSSVGTKTLTLGSSTIILSRWAANSITTFNYDTSTIKLLTSGNYINLGKGYNVEIYYNSSTIQPIGGNSSLTVYNNLVLSGYSNTQRLLLGSYTLGASVSIIVDPNKVTASYVDFRDTIFTNPINLSGITGGSGDCGGNSGITFTTSQTQYWYQGTGNWSDSTKWFTQTSGIIQGRMPLPQDTAIFDQNSFSGTSTVTVNVPRLSSLDMSNVSTGVTLSIGATECYGDYILGDYITHINNNVISFYGRNNNFILNTYSKNMYYLKFFAFNSTYLNMSNLISGTIYILNGTVDFNDFDSICGWLYAETLTTIYLGSGTHTQTWNLSGNYIGFSPTCTLYSEGSTIKLTPYGSSNINFLGSGKLYNKIWLSGTHTGNFDIYGNNNINELIVDAGKKIRFTEGTTNIINTLTAIGTPDSGITITSISSGLTHTLVKTGTGAINVKYATISYSSGSTSFVARNSTDAGSNSGWMFPASLYWIGNSGNWSDPTHWSSTSGGPSGATSLGTNLVSNGSFDTDTVWFKGAGSTINNGLGHINSPVQNGVFTQSTTTLMSGKTYNVSFDILNFSTGGIKIYFGGFTYLQMTFYSYDGHYSYDVVNDNNNSPIVIYTSSSTSNILDVDNVVVREVIRTPNIGSDVLFDQNSFTITGSTVTVDTTGTCMTMDWTGLNKTVTFFNNTYDFNIYGSLILITGLTWNFVYTSTGYLKFKGSNLGNFITTNSVVAQSNQVWFDNVSGSWIHLDDCNFNQTYMLPQNGIWDTNGKTITASLFAGSSGSMTLNFGSSLIIIPAGIQWATAPSTMTINAGTSTIRTSHSNYFRGIGKTFYNLEFLTSSGSIGGVNISDFTCNNLYIYNSINTVSEFIFGTNDIKINGTLTISGNTSTKYRLLVRSDTIGTQRKITTNNVVAQNVDFRDIYLSGSTTFVLSGITGGSGDSTGNSGITFTPSQTQYFKHTSGAVNWSDSTKWVTSSGGLTLGRVPLPQDNMIFDENSFTNTSTVTIDVPRIGSLTMSGVTKTVTVTQNAIMECYGNFTLGSKIIWNSSIYINLYGRGNYQFNSFGSILLLSNINNPNGTYTLMGNLMTVGGYGTTIQGGTTDFNDFDTTFYVLSASGNLYMGNGTSTITYYNAGPTTLNFNAAALNLYAENSTIKFDWSGGTAISTMYGGGKSYNKVWFSGGHTGTYDIVGSNTFNEIKIDAGRKVRFTNATNTTVSRFISLGKPTNLVTISSVPSGSTHNISSLPNDWLVDYTNIQDSVTPPTKYAGVNSVNVSNNTGWDFTTSKIRYWVGNSGTFTDTSHWSLQSNGVGGASVPASGETAIFDRYSFTSTGQTVTLSEETSLSSMYWEDVTQSGTTLFSNYNLNLYGSLYLATGMIWNINANLNFKSTYTGNIIYTKGTTLNVNNIYFDNISGVWTIGDNFTTTGNIHHVNGTWNTGDKIITVQNYYLDSGTTKQLILGSSTFNTNVFNISDNSTNYTITPNTSKIVSSGLTMLNQTLYDVETSNISSISPTFHNLKISSGTTWIVSGNPTITGLLQIDGSTNKFLLSSNILRTQRTINATNVLFSNVDIIDIKSDGGWNLSGSSVGDGGGNTNIIFPISTNQYWIGGSGNWSDVSKWTSGVPLLQDIAIFDQNSFTGTSTLTLDMLTSGINMSGVTNQVTIFGNLPIFGDVYANNYVTFNDNLELYGRTNKYLSLSGGTINNINIYGNYTNLSYLKSNILNLNEGSLNLGNTTVEVNEWLVQQSGLLDADTSTIKLTPSGSTDFTFNGGNDTYYNLWLSGTHTGYFNVLGNNTFNELKIDDGRKVKFESNSVQSLNSLHAIGTSDSGITITSTSTSQHYLKLLQKKPFLVSSYLNVSYSNVQPLNKFFATDSINSGFNTGWRFSIPPLFVWIQDNMGILVDSTGKFLW